MTSPDLLARSRDLNVGADTALSMVNDVEQGCYNVEWALLLAKAKRRLLSLDRKESALAVHSKETK